MKRQFVISHNQGHREEREEEPVIFTGGPEEQD
jgi:hypothetical protein